jgi:4-amino-4-deoxy-L-arabinose transferase-like glycosyltransferase
VTLVVPEAEAVPEVTPKRRRRVAWLSPVDQPAWAGPALLAVAALAALLYLWGIWSNRMRSPYYGAAVYSMAHSWRAFLYGAFDPAASITIDKIPLAFQIQALFVRVFGFHNWVLVLPNAIAGVVAVLVLYRVVRRWAGPAAGLIAALVLALTPINAALDRSPQADGLLVLAVVLAADAWQRAVSTGRLRPLLLSGVWVGVAFHVKMAQAWAVLPAFAIAYLLAAPGPVLRRLGRLGAGGGVTLAVSSVWMLLVKLTPAGSRPYVDGSTNNSVFAMVFGYNFFTRFDGLNSDAAGVGSVLGGPGSRTNTFTSPWQFLFEPNTASQISWLLPLSALALVIGLLWRWRAPRTDLLRAGFVMWGVWLLTHAVAFSVGHVAHTFYTAVMAPAIGALSGAGLVLLRRALRRRTAWGWALPAVVVVTVAWAVHLGQSYPTFLPWLAPTAVVAGTVAVVVLVALLLGHDRIRRFAPRVATAGVGLALGAMLLTPGAWAASTIAGYGGNAIGPSAGPTSTFPTGSMGGGGRLFGPGAGGAFTGGSAARDGGVTPPGGAGARDGGGFPGGGVPGGGQARGRSGGGAAFGEGVDETLVAFLKSHQGKASYAVAISGANTAGPYIVAGLSVLPMGGFTGQVPFPSVDQLQQLIADGQLRYVLASGGGGGPGGSGGSSDAMSWVTQSCTTVDYGGLATLYDCAGG